MNKNQVDKLMTDLHLKRPNWLHTLNNSLFIDLLLIALAILSIGLLLIELIIGLESKWLLMIYQIDLAIALFFLADFLLGLYLTPNKKKYFQKHWTDLLASIPVTEGIFRTLRALRLLRLTRIVTSLTTTRTRTNHSARLIYLIISTFIVILSSAIFFFDAEQVANPLVNVFSDSLWWTVSTMTGTGMSEINPTTGAGRLIGGLSMFSGVILTGLIAGIVAHYFIDKSDF